MKYTPDDGFVTAGKDKFSYSVSDGSSTVFADVYVLVEDLKKPINRNVIKKVSLIYNWCSACVTQFINLGGHYVRNHPGICFRNGRYSRGRN